MGLCPKCHGIIEWRKKYRKYKPLKAPRKCGSCSNRTIVRAYHAICAKCRAKKEVCAKCLLPRTQWKSVEEEEEEEEEGEEEEVQGAKADGNDANIPNKSDIDENESNDIKATTATAIDTVERTEQKSVSSSSSKQQPTRKELLQRLDDPDVRERERRTILRKLEQI